MHRITTVI